MEEILKNTSASSTGSTDAFDKVVLALWSGHWWCWKETLPSQFPLWIKTFTDNLQMYLYFQDFAFVVEGVMMMSIGAFGIVSNITSIVFFFRQSSQRTFHRCVSEDWRFKPRIPKYKEVKVKPLMWLRVKRKDALSFHENQRANIGHYKFFCRSCSLVTSALTLTLTIAFGLTLCRITGWVLIHVF